jgi:hypothetical protein
VPANEVDSKNEAVIAASPDLIETDLNPTGGLYAAVSVFKTKAVFQRNLSMPTPKPDFVNPFGVRDEWLERPSILLFDTRCIRRVPFAGWA